MISSLEAENAARRQHGTERTQSVKVHWKDKPMKGNYHAKYFLLTRYKNVLVGNI
jgi:hypothetical protein